MIKKRLVVIILIMLLFLSVFFTLFYFSKYKNTDNNLKEKNISKQNEIIEQEITIPDKEEITETKTDQNITNNNSNEKVVESTTPIIPEDKTIIENNNSSNTKIDSTTPVVENKVDITEEQNNNTSNEVIPPVVEEEKKQEIFIDEELEILKKQVEFSTYDECMKVGFDTALEDTINILGFSCPYIVYKGQILGYRLQLDYTNPMEN